MQVSRALTLGLVILLISLAEAQSPGADPDSSGPFAAVVHTSAFLHGYLHGYEAGFHDGNLDLQMGRVADLRRYRHESDGYNSEFGNRARFQRGFHQGFQVAYADALSDRRFRAAQSLLEVEACLPAPVKSADPALDAALSDGYSQGLRKGLDDARAGAAFAATAGDCQASSSKTSNHTSAPRSADKNARGKHAIPETYCPAYDGGFLLGYTDGYTNQRATPSIVATTASK